MQQGSSPSDIGSASDNEENVDIEKITDHDAAMDQLVHQFSKLSIF